MKKSRRKTSITKRWVRGSLLFTLAVVLIAGGVFLFFTITGYYDNAEVAMYNQFDVLREQMKLSSTATGEQRSLRLISTVEQFAAKPQFELMLIRENGAVEATSSGIMPQYSQVPADIAEALSLGGNGTGRYIGLNETGERVLAITVPTPYSTQRIVAMRLVTSLTLVERNVQNIVVATVLIIGAIILASVISGVYFIRSIVYPLQRVEASAARIAEGDFDIRITAKTNDEIGTLCGTINHMAEELSHSERMKNEFISSVSHELRTPLTSIKGWAETMGSINDPGDPNYRRGIEIIGGEADRLYAMVEELLDFSRIQDGFKLDTELLDLAAEVEESVLLNTARASGLGVALLYAVPELPVPVMADRNRLRQVFVNVLDNAIKYSYTGGEVDVEILQDAGNAYVVISDQGQGIAPEDLEYVRQKFYKGKGALRGSGIGLAVVEELMGAHGGDMQIASTLGQGTQVTLRLPLHHRTEKEQPTETPPRAEKQRRGWRAKEKLDDKTGETH